MPGSEGVPKDLAAHAKLETARLAAALKDLEAVHADNRSYTDIVKAYFKARAGHRGIKAARSQYDAWLAIAGAANWKTPEDVKKAHPKAKPSVKVLRDM